MERSFVGSTPDQNSSSLPQSSQRLRQEGIGKKIHELLIEIGTKEQSDKSTTEDTRTQKEECNRLLEELSHKQV